MDNGESQAAPSDREIKNERAATPRLALLTSKKIIISKFLDFSRNAPALTFTFFKI